MTCSDLLDNHFWEQSRWNASQYGSELFLYLAQIVPMLTIQPELGRNPAQSFETSGHGGGNRGIAGQNPVERLASDSEISCSLSDRQAQAWQHMIAQ
jgi:hypothetical protein